MTTIIGIGLLAGFLIGSVGVGGVIVVPALTYFANIDIRYAIAAALMSFVFSGVVGTLRYMQNGSVPLALAGALTLAAVPGTIIGTLMVHRANPILIKCLIGTVVLAAGLQSIIGPKPSERAGSALSSPKLATIGAVVGFGSVATGSGGPLLLIPILLWLQQPILMAIGLSQVIQLPISIVATATNFAAGSIDIRLGTILAIAVAIGCWYGASVAHRLPAKAIRTGLSYLLIVIGVAVVADAAYEVHG